ncbi:subtilisin-like protein [Anaeromyces robustus]|uniref:Subtilisin-like protein n=1 Tax=Anaeromyces robustus TaxID=1754192 RepID=A0A1Y1X5D3_9FUNG|nr:subtilisin-like protein [Anaeromyces robustus]|eukprot:ORX80524.1 subtilisin-like protein [Anaeromyces robustus]
MKNSFLLISIFILINYCIGSYTKNSYFTVAILRDKSDKNYDDESITIQNKINKLVNDKMNEIYKIIEENKDSYILENGEMDEKLNELSKSSSLKKRSDKNVEFIFKNDIRPNNTYNPSNEITKRNKLSSDSSVEYIPFESVLVSYTCPILNYYAINVYLSDVTENIVCNLENVYFCEPVSKIEFLDHQFNKRDNDNNMKINKSNLNEYYDIEAIKKETNWENVEVQPFNFTGFSNPLSLISQGPKVHYGNTYDENYYYPSSAGKGIDIYFMDSGLLLNHEHFDTYEGTPYKRNITCDAYFNQSNQIFYNDEQTQNECWDPSKDHDESSEYKFDYDRPDYPIHGISVASSAGGTLLGVAKKANLHMIAVFDSSNNIVKGLDYILQHGKPHKTVISLSIGTDGKKRAEEDKINELIEKGFIIIVSAGNDNMNCCGYRNTPLSKYDSTIVVGATNSNIINNKYIKSYYSNYGKCVDIHAPGSVVIPLIDSQSVSYKEIDGTSFSTPIVAGVAATIITNEKTLIDMSIKDNIVGFDSSDTPNRFINNGKKINFTPDGGSLSLKCGPLANNAKCINGCCSKDGKCIKFNDELASEQCLIENGCQNDFGYCTTPEKAIEECEKEIMEYDICQIDTNYYDSLSHRCRIISSDKCKMFYERIHTNQTVCTIAKKYKNFEKNISNFDRKKYVTFMYDCEDECDTFLEECYYDGNYNLSNICNNFKTNLCPSFYDYKSNANYGFVCNTSDLPSELYSPDKITNMYNYMKEILKYINNDYEMDAQYK